MRIAKASLNRRWFWSVGLGFLVFAFLFFLDRMLQSLTGVGTWDLAPLTDAAEIRTAIHAWAPQPYATLAGFNLGLGFLLMPLYAAAFFYSGIIAAERFAPAPGRRRGFIVIASMAPLAGALCNAVQNALYLMMMLGGDTLAYTGPAHMFGSIKQATILVGLLLLAAAIVARLLPVKK